MPAAGVPGTERVRAVELVGALCLATDIGMGLPLEHGLRSTLFTARLRERAGADSMRAHRAASRRRTCRGRAPGATSGSTQGEWWPNYAERQLALSTQEAHSIDLDLRILPRLGDIRLTQLRPSVVERFAAELERAGTGRATIVSTLTVLQGVMKRAVRDYNLPGNPVKQTWRRRASRGRDPRDDWTRSRTRRDAR